MFDPKRRAAVRGLGVGLDRARQRHIQIDLGPHRFADGASREGQ